MAGKPSRPSFLWQGVLILLPVVVLAVIGWASLRQDKILAEHDARERAQIVANNFLRKFWGELAAKPSGNWTESDQDLYEIDNRGYLIFPPPEPPLPTPKPFDLAELTSEQAPLWMILRNADAGSQDSAAIVKALKSFTSSHPPKNFAAAAQYRAGLLLEREGKNFEAASAFHVIARELPDAVSESGLPFLPLAQLKQIELMAKTPNETRWTNEAPVESFYSNIVLHPTVLTPEFLERAKQPGEAPFVGSGASPYRKWRGTWENHELRRRFFLPFSGRIDTNSNPKVAHFIWFNMPDEKFWEHVSRHWLATRLTDESSNHETNAWIFLRPESELGDMITSFTRHDEQISEYFGIGVEVAGKRITEKTPVLSYWRKGQYRQISYSDKVVTNLLASAVQSEDGVEQLRVNVYLTNPDELFAAQQSRATWFGLLVTASTAAALIGLFAAWRAFNRQLRLAEMKSNFVSSVSHELRAPIASVRLMAESLERGKVNEPQKQNEYFRFIVQECRRLSSLIENVLDFSRIEQGRKQYEFEPTDLAALTRETVKLMEPYAEEKGVKLETFNIQHSTSNVELEIDGRAIQQALINLMDNAIKHSAKGQTVTVGLDPGERRTGVPPVSNLSEKEDNTETGRMPVLLYVQDHGAGIPPAEHEKIFERFYRLGSELRRETQGVGIGLSIVRHIVAAHGGKVTVRSNLGEGSRFTIVLPINIKPQRNADERR